MTYSLRLYKDIAQVYKKQDGFFALPAHYHKSIKLKQWINRVSNLNIKQNQNISISPKTIKHGTELFIKIKSKTMICRLFVDRIFL